MSDQDFAILGQIIAGHLAKDNHLCISAERIAKIEGRMDAVVESQSKICDKWDEFKRAAVEQHVEIMTSISAIKGNRDVKVAIITATATVLVALIGGKATGIL